MNYDQTRPDKRFEDPSGRDWAAWLYKIIEEQYENFPLGLRTEDIKAIAHADGRDISNGFRYLMQEGAIQKKYVTGVVHYFPEWVTELPKHILPPSQQRFFDYIVGHKTGFITFTEFHEQCDHPKGSCGQATEALVSKGRISVQHNGSIGKGGQSSVNHYKALPESEWL